MHCEYDASHYDYPLISLELFYTYSYGFQPQMRPHMNILYAQIPLSDKLIQEFQDKGTLAEFV